MGAPIIPQEAAPAYDDVFEDHPVNQFAPSGSRSAYAAVPQNDDVELAHQHNHTSPSSTPAPTASLAQTIAGVFKPAPHVHCEQCDIQLAAKQRHAKEKHCCALTATVFIVALICAMLLGIVVVSKVTAHKGPRHD